MSNKKPTANLVDVKAELYLLFNEAVEMQNHYKDCTDGLSRTENYRLQNRTAIATIARAIAETERELREKQEMLEKKESLKQKKTVISPAKKSNKPK